MNKSCISKSWNFVMWAPSCASLLQLNENEKITKPVNSWRSSNPVTHGTRKTHKKTDRKHTDKVGCRLATLRDRQQKINLIPMKSL